MNGQEIKAEIERNNDAIVQAQSVGFFTLNKTIAEAMEKIKYLQSICPHEYSKTGYCIYCNQKEDK